MSRTDASILHVDADAFFAAVEQRDHPELRGLPVAVGSGVVMAASYEARRFGIHGGMNGRRARQLCPAIRFAQPRFSAYQAASRQLFEVFRDHSPAVEGLSLEEAFIDAAGLERIVGAPLEIGEKLRRRVRERVGLAVTVGIGRTKLVAKMASRTAKPDGLLLVAPADERRFLDRLELGELWGVGEKTATRLARHGLRRVEDAARLPESSLTAILGPAGGRHLHALVRNERSSPVRQRRGRSSVGAQHALGRGRRSDAELGSIVTSLVERIARRLRAGGRGARTVSLRLRFDDFSRATRSLTLSAPTAASGLIEIAARSLLDAAREEIEARGLTLIGLAVTNLTAPGAGVQLGLPLDSGASQDLDLALDEVRERFGPAAVRRGRPTDRWLET